MVEKYNSAATSLIRLPFFPLFTMYSLIIFCTTSSGTLYLAEIIFIFFFFLYSLIIDLLNRSIEDLPIRIKDDLYLIPSFIDFEGFAKYLYKNTSNDKEEDFFLSKYFEPLKKKFDLIILDVPPMSIEITKNAVTSSDYVLISLQTQEYSLTGAESYVDELGKLTTEYDLDLDVVGILPVLMKNHGKVDEYILDSAKESFGEENIFKTYIPQMERIKRFAVNGITDQDRHDRKVLSVYEKVTDELLNRLAQFNVQ